MKKQRKMMAPKARYFGTEDERAEIAVKWLNEEELTLDECSKVMGLSKSAIKAIECRALAKLKKALMAKYGKNVCLSDFISTGSRRQFALKHEPEEV